MWPNEKAPGRRFCQGEVQDKKSDAKQRAVGLSDFQPAAALPILGRCLCQSPPSASMKWWAFKTSSKLIGDWLANHSWSRLVQSSGNSERVRLVELGLVP